MATRREFTKQLGSTLVAPMVAAGSPAALWAQAEREVEQLEEVSPELARMLLDLQGTRGIFAEPEHFEELRRALARKIRDHRIIRAFELPADIEPILLFDR